jgi:hypothetical protein
VQMVDIDITSTIRTSFATSVIEWKQCMQLPDVKKAQFAYNTIAAQCRGWMEWIKVSPRG